MLGDRKKQIVKLTGLITVIVGAFYIGSALGAQDIGEVATNVTKTFGKLSKLVTAAAYVAGLGFAVGAILKFKAHKDNPTQIPVGTPIALLFVAAALLFLPSILGMTGKTLFGTTPTAGGPSGISDILQETGS